MIMKAIISGQLQKTSPDDVFMTMYFQFALYDNKFFIAQNLAFINKPTPKDSGYGLFAWLIVLTKKKRYSKIRHISGVKRKL